MRVAMDAVRECPPLGIYLLVGALADEAHDVKLVDLVAERTNRLDAHLDALAVADLVGVGATSMSWPTARDVIGQVRAARPDVPVVLGGVHPTLFDAFVLGTTGADYVVRGEAESALRVLCRVLEGDGQLGEVPNLSWRTADGGMVELIHALAVIVARLEREERERQESFYQLLHQVGPIVVSVEMCQFVQQDVLQFGR